MVKWALGSLVLFLGAILSFILWRTGYFKEVTIASGNKGPYVLVYKEHVGSYHEIPGTIAAVENFFKESKWNCPMAFGRYLDDPEIVDHDRLRSHGGCLISGTDTSTFKQLPEEFKMEVLEEKEYVLSTFNGSPSIGPFVVYPKVMKWLKKYGYEINGPVIESYKTLPDNSVLTTYHFPYK